MMNAEVSKNIYRTALLEDFPSDISLRCGEREVNYRKVTWTDGENNVGLRYGENPHQPAAYYVPESTRPLSWLKMGKGGPSWINLADIDHACRILRNFEQPAALIMKHLNPAGVAVGKKEEEMAELYRRARHCDERSSFGGVAVFNRMVDEETAIEVLSTFMEAVAAPGFSDEALDVLSRKKDLRVAQVLLDYSGAALDLKVLSDGSLLVQTPYSTRIRTVDDFLIRPEAAGVVCQRIPTEEESIDLLFAWQVNGGVRSNGIVLARGGRTLAIGTGEQERVGAVEQAIAKAHQKGHRLQGAVVSSDAFFPFPDAIEALAAAGITAIIQPGGSLRDAEVIRACNERGIAMVTTGERCFAHF